VRIPAATYFFYGISNLLPEESVKSVKVDRAKQFSASDIALFEEVYRLGRKFIDTVSTLPLLPTTDFARNDRRFEQAFAHARAQVENASPLYASYLRLQERVPPAIAGDIVAYSEATPVQLRSLKCR